MLDLHFSPHRPEILAIATSTGIVEIYQLHLVRTIRLERLRMVQAFEPTTLVLSLAWHPSPQRSTELAVSLSNGNVALVDYSQTRSVRWIKEAHSLEAWTVSWSSVIGPSGDCALYSGGDDSGLRTFSAEQLSSHVTDIDRETRSGAFLTGPDFNAKIHGAGVTAILPIRPSDNSSQETILTGSYDEYIRVLVLSAKGTWKAVAEKRLGGGVWRLKQLASLGIAGAASPTEGSFRVLASCMHAGARVLEIHKTGEETWSIKVLYKFEEHESMNYGSDATILQSQEEGTEPSLLMSTSFYDRRLCLWMIPGPGMVPDLKAVSVR